MENIVLKTAGLSKSFHDPVTMPVLKGISIAIRRGEFVSITGKSGCGKSTLLYILSTMDTDFEGDLFLDNEAMRGRSDRYLARVRNEKIGFVFQFHYLLSEFSALDNVMLPGLKYNALPEEQIRVKALQILESLDIKPLAAKRANQLSGGEKQRVAIARALINDPLIVMCDEPTGNLDKANSLVVFDIFKELAEKRGQTLLVVTHDQEFAQNTQRIIVMEDGRIAQ
jgi:lipoprotein-releasing system ATP-binding protein